MADKIILFLSRFDENNSKIDTAEYTCPNGMTVTGRQTNEAPVKYLLSVHPNIREILCIVTKDAKDQGWDYFRTRLAASFPSVTPVAISFAEGESFQVGPMSRIMERMQEGDSVWLESTGGLRDSVLHLTLLTRVLSSVGIHVAGAVYSNFQTHTVDDITDVYRLFDLVEGMHDLSAFGDAAALRHYYGSPAADARIEALLRATESLEESINLCRTPAVPDCLSAFNAALTEAKACNDPLLTWLLPAFQEKFGEALTIPGLIRWCLSSRKIQQALTIYNERIPGWLFAPENGFFSEIPPLPESSMSWKDPYSVLLVDSLIKPMQANRNAKDPGSLASAFRTYLQSFKESLPGYLLSSPKTGTPAFDLAIKNIALAAKLAYPGNGTSKDPKWASRLPKGKSHLAELQKQMVPNLRTGFLKNVLVWKAEFLNIVLETEDGEATVTSSAPNAEPASDEMERNLKAALDAGPFVCHCSLSELKTLLMDYQFCKELRNMMNHANDKTTSDHQSILRMLSEEGYPYVEQVGSNEIIRQVIQCLDHLMLFRTRSLS